jgi:hypothetical protein
LYGEPEVWRGSPAQMIALIALLAAEVIRGEVFV